MRRFCVILTFLVLTTAVLTAIFSARRTQFWYDEVLTVTTASQGSLKGIWTALTYGADANPPFFYVVERSASRFFSDPEVGFRISSILALAIAVSAMFFFALPRIGPVGASIVSVSLLFTTLYRDYTIDARPYVMVSACVALALVAWQRADGRRALVSLGILCLVAESLHYYAIYAIAAIAFGEAVRSARLRRFRPLVWIAFSAALVPPVLCWPLLARARQVYSAHFWAQPDITDVPRVYMQVLGFPGAVIMALMLIAGFGPHLLAWRRNPKLRSSFNPEECAAAIALIFVPLIGILVAKISQGGMAPRYGLSAVLGASIAVGHITSRASRIAVAVLLVLVAVAGAQQAHQWQEFRESPLARSGNIAEVLKGMLRESGNGGIPVVVSSGLDYLPIAYYGPRPFDPSIVSLLDPEKAVAYQKTDSVEVGLRLLNRYWPLNTAGIPGVLAESQPVSAPVERRTVRLVAGTAEGRRLLPHAAGEALPPHTVPGHPKCSAALTIFKPAVEPADR